MNVAVKSGMQENEKCNNVFYSISEETRTDQTLEKPDESYLHCHSPLFYPPFNCQVSKVGKKGKLNRPVSYVQYWNGWLTKWRLMQRI